MRCGCNVRWCECFLYLSSMSFSIDRTSQMGAVLNAACCAGTCRQPLDINSLDYDNVRFPAYARTFAENTDYFWHISARSTLRWLAIVHTNLADAL